MKRRKQPNDLKSVEGDIRATETGLKQLRGGLWEPLKKKTKEHKQKEELKREGGLK